MSQATDKLEKQVANATGFLGVVAKFVQRLGDPSKYEYRGECIDLGRPTGKCTCDHPIRYVFPIYNPETGAMAPCGSECINHFQSYNPELFARLQKAVEKLERKLADEQIALNRAKRLAEADEVRPAYLEAKAKAEKYIADWKAKNTWAKYLPTELWKLQLELQKSEPEYKQPVHYRKFYTRMTEFYNNTVTAHQQKEASRPKPQWLVEKEAREAARAAQANQPASTPTPAPLPTGRRLTADEQKARFGDCPF